MEGLMPTISDFSRLSPRALAKLLTDAARQRVTVAALKADVAAGAPTNPDGTMDLVAYAAWLLARRAEKPR